MKESSFSERLAIALKNSGMRQIDLANKTNLDKSLISNYLKGTYEAKQDILSLLAKALNVNEVWLMGYSVPMNSLTDKNLQLERYQEKDELDDLFDSCREHLTESDIELMKTIMRQRMKEIDKELDERDDN